MNSKLEKGWKKVLESYFSSDKFTSLNKFLEHEYQEKTIYPHIKDIFSAFNNTSFEEVQVIILGQDPYHNEGQAHGLSFSVPKGITPPPSLKNIYKEISQSTGVIKDTTVGNLNSWAEQGVLLLNAVLTVEKNKPGSHANKGWEEFTDYVIQTISLRKEHCVFILWGKYAQKKINLIDGSKHLILTSAHPSPFSAHLGFLGNNHFNLTNEYLQNHGKEPIQW